MGKIKEIAIEREQKLDESIKKLEENSEKLKCMKFEEEPDIGKIKTVTSEVLSLLKQIKEVFLL